MLVGTLKRYSTQQTDLSPRVHGRYFKFIPKLWGKNSYPCMGIEMLGCDKNEGSQDYAIILIRVVTLSNKHTLSMSDYKLLG